MVKSKRIIVNEAFSASSGANATVVNRVLSLWNNNLSTPALERICEFNKVEGIKFKYTAYNAGTASVTTFTPAGSPTALDNFVLKVMATNSVTGKLETRRYRYVAITGDTATTLNDGIRAAIARDGNARIVGSGTSTLILTSAAGWEVADCRFEKAQTVMARVLTTPGVCSKGTPAHVTAQGAQAGVAGATYSLYEFLYGDLIQDGGQTVRNQATYLKYYVNIAGSNGTQATTDIAAALSIGDETTDLS